MKEIKTKAFSSSTISLKDSTLTEDTVEDRQEHMVLPSENSRPSNEKPHLLKPCFTISIDESEAVLPPQNGSTSSPLVSNALYKSVSFRGFRLPHINFKSWARKMSHLHKPTWEKAGIFEAVMASNKRIFKNKELVLCIAEKWCSDTRTFVFPWGEATITLEDVMVLLGFSVLGSTVFATLDSSGEKTKEKVEKEWTKIKREKLGFVTQAVWIKRFLNCGDDELEHVTFLALWLSYYVFPSSYYNIPRTILPIAVHLSKGTRIALAPAVLSHLYADLTLLKDHIRDFTQGKYADKIELTSLFKLVQVWTWERFKELQPKPNPMLKGEPRLNLWNDLKQPRTRDVKQILERMDSFEWRPYTKTVENWDFPKFYPEKAMWIPLGLNTDDEFISFARCIKVSELAGIDCLELYFPNRVASQFGFIQDVPVAVDRNNLSKKASWNDYDKPIDGVTLYIPSRYARPPFSPMFWEWWRTSFLEFQYCSEENLAVESAESLPPRNISGEGDTSNFVALGYKRRKLVCEDDDSNIGRCQTQVASGNDAQMMRLQKKRYSREDACEPLGKKSRHEADNNGLGNASISPYETDPSDPHVDFDGVVVPPPGIMKFCDDELDVCGSNVEKMITMTDDGSKEPECFLHEDGAKAREKYSSESLIQKGDNVADDDSLIQKKLAIDETVLKADTNELIPRQKLASGGTNGDETSKAYTSMFQCPSDEPNTHISVGDGTQGQDCLFHDDDLGSEENMKSDEEIDFLMSSPETRKTYDDELDVYGSNVEKMAMTDNSSKAPECLLHENGTTVGEKASSDEKDDAVVDDDSLIQKKLSSNADNNEPTPCQKLAPGRFETPDKSNIHIAEYDGTWGRDCLLTDTGFGSAETMISNEQSENLEKRNEDVGEGDVGNDSFQKSLHNAKVLASLIEQRIIKAQRDVVSLKERIAMKQRKIAVATLI